jgi:hypothetical protein
MLLYATLSELTGGDERIMGRGNADEGLVRPDRFEPRKRKRPPVKFDQMMKPRWVLKREMAKRVSDN